MFFSYSPHTLTVVTVIKKWSTASVRHNAASTKVNSCDQAIFFTRYSIVATFHDFIDVNCVLITFVCMLSVCNCSVLLIISCFCGFYYHPMLFFPFIFVFCLSRVVFCESVYLAAWLLRNSKQPVTQYPIPAITVPGRMRYSRHKRSPGLLLAAISDLASL